MSTGTHLVEPAIVEYLSHAPLERRVTYSAGCAERWAQVFTGLRARRGGRERDIEYVVELMDGLWGSQDSRIAPDAPDALMRFPEFQPRDRPSPAVEDIYSFYAILIVRYAAAVALGDSTVTVSSGHASLTAAWQLDQNVPDGDRQYEQELEFQREITVLADADSLADYRARCQEVSRLRLGVVQGRIR